MASLERAILASARITLKNPKLNQKDILEWSTGPIGTTAVETEIVVRLPDPGVNICVLKIHDNRALNPKNKGK